MAELCSDLRAVVKGDTVFVIDGGNAYTLREVARVTPTQAIVQFGGSYTVRFRLVDGRQVGHDAYDGLRAFVNDDAAKVVYSARLREQRVHVLAARLDEISWRWKPEAVLVAVAQALVDQGAAGPAVKKALAALEEVQ